MRAYILPIIGKTIRKLRPVPSEHAADAIRGENIRRQAVVKTHINLLQSSRLPDD